MSNVSGRRRLGAVFDLIAVLEPRLSDAQIAKVRDDISWTFASGRIEQDATNPLRATCHSPRQPGEYVVTASCGDSSRVMLVKVGTYKIHEVTFHNNIPIQKDTTSELQATIGVTTTLMAYQI